MSTITESASPAAYELQYRNAAHENITNKQDGIGTFQSAATASVPGQFALVNSATEEPATTTTTTTKVYRQNLIIFQVALINFLSSMSTGMIVVGLPRMASDLALPARLYLWPTSVYGLTTGSSLLLAGAVADVIGTRTVEFWGSLLVGVFTLSCGLSQTGIQLVMFRALQGIGIALDVPSSVSLITQHVPSGKRRNIGFACLGMSMPLGYSLGLVVGGILADTIGWRVGFYIAGSIILAQAFAGLKIIPVQPKQPQVISKLLHEIDWVGAVIASACLSMFSYVLSVLSTDSNNIRSPLTITLLVGSLVLMALFPIWMNRQENRRRPTLIPNRLWKNKSFSTICVLSVICWGVGNSIELFSNLFFQEVQELSALQASIRLIPALLVGAILNLSTGFFVDRAPVFWLVLVSTLLTAGCPLLMALINPGWPYWYGAFPAQLLAPLSGDILFTVGLIVVSEVFPEREQALAGAVYNTVCYFGWALGINSMQVVSTLVTKGTSYRDKSSPAALLKGYQASFFAMFAATLACAVITVFGLRNLGKIGVKRD